MKFTIKIAEPKDVTNIHNLMENVYENLEDKSLFFCDDLDYVQRHIKNEGFAIKVEQNGKLVASLIVRFPGNAEDNLGRDVGLEEIHKVAHIESIVVDAKYRGNGLQDKMIKFAEEVIFRRGYTYLMATVSPDNKHSLDNFERNGYEVKKVKEKYGGLRRAILLKK